MMFFFLDGEITCLFVLVSMKENERNIVSDRKLSQILTRVLWKDFLLAILIVQLAFSHFLRGICTSSILCVLLLSSCCNYCIVHVQIWLNIYIA